MSEVWVAIPSANAPLCGETFAVWQARGYRTAVLVDGDTPDPANADMIVRTPDYRGYGWAVNTLCRALTDVDWVVTGGDDILPDPDHAPEDIAAECVKHFKGTFGVMQPVGDPWNDYCIKKCAGSPWMGKDFRRRINQGRGPYIEDFVHYYDDTYLRATCIRYGCYWEHPDITHTHEHWTKKKVARPAYLVKAEARVETSRLLFEKLVREGFVGTEPLPR
jgi:hypothetical protein